MSALQNTVAALFKQFAGQQSILTIPRPYIDLCDGDHLAALFLSQLVYWTDRTKDDEGWVVKSYKEWDDELAMSQYQINRLAKSLKPLGVVSQVKKSKFHGGAPTVHYRIDKDVFSFSIMKKLDNPELSRNSIIKNEAAAQSLNTETTAKTTTETTVIPPTPIIPVMQPQTPAISGSQANLAEPEPSKEKKPTFQETIVAIWGEKNRGIAGTLISQMVGNAKAGKRHDYRFETPVTLEEIQGFGLWYKKQFPNATMPTAAETLKERFDQFRGLPDYENYMHPAAAESHMSETNAQRTLIKAWLGASGFIHTAPYEDVTHLSLASQMHDKGIVPKDIQGVIQDMRDEDFWRGKPIEFAAIAKRVIPWKEASSFVPPEHRPYVPTPKKRTSATVEEIRARTLAVARQMRAVSLEEAEQLEREGAL